MISPASYENTSYLREHLERAYHYLDKGVRPSYEDLLSWAPARVITYPSWVTSLDVGQGWLTASNQGKCRMPSNHLISQPTLISQSSTLLCTSLAKGTFSAQMADRAQTLVGTESLGKLSKDSRSECFFCC
jgi:hypothetical protein